MSQELNPAVDKPDRIEAGEFSDHLEFLAERRYEDSLAQAGLDTEYLNTLGEEFKVEEIYALLGSKVIDAGFKDFLPRPEFVSDDKVILDHKDEYADVYSPLPVFNSSIIPFLLDKGFTLLQAVDVNALSNASQVLTTRRNLNGDILLRNAIGRIIDFISNIGDESEITNLWTRMRRTQQIAVRITGDEFAFFSKDNKRSSITLESINNSLKGIKSFFSFGNKIVYKQVQVKNIDLERKSSKNDISSPRRNKLPEEEIDFQKRIEDLDLKHRDFKKFKDPILNIPNKQVRNDLLTLFENVYTDKLLQPVAEELSRRFDKNINVYKDIDEYLEVVSVLSDFYAEGGTFYQSSIEGILKWANDDKELGYGVGNDIIEYIFSQGARALMSHTDNIAVFIKGGSDFIWFVPGISEIESVQIEEDVSNYIDNEVRYTTNVKSKEKSFYILAATVSEEFENSGLFRGEHHTIARLRENRNYFAKIQEKLAEKMDFKKAVEVAGIDEENLIDKDYFDIAGMYNPFDEKRGFMRLKRLGLKDDEIIGLEKFYYKNENDEMQLKITNKHTFLKQLMMYGRRKGRIIMNS